MIYFLGVSFAVIGLIGLACIFPWLWFIYGIVIGIVLLSSKA